MVPSIPMKVLLVHAHESAKKTAGSYRRFLKPIPPISLAYIAAAREDAGLYYNSEILLAFLPHRIDNEKEIDSPDTVPH